ncbi:hypothetical protein E4P43_18235 [Blastococcus sp. TF02A-35]|nr:hypothetical protein E4P43_18235 [Blastococcus sp. TF02A_35]
MGRKALGLVERGEIDVTPQRRDENGKWKWAASSRSAERWPARCYFRGLGYPWATPHTLRRTVVALLHAAGVPLVTIADQLGHADLAMTARVYLGRDLMGDRQSVAQWLQRVTEPVTHSETYRAPLQQRGSIRRKRARQGSNLRPSA